MFDKVFLNGQLRVADRWLPTDQAVATLNGRIAAIGPAAEFSAAVTVDLAGGYILPGFTELMSIRAKPAWRRTSAISRPSSC